MSKFFTTILPSLLAGGLLFGSALTDAQPAPPAPPSPPPPAAIPPKPPKPPKAPKVSIDIDLGDLDKMIDGQIKYALEALGSDPSVPPQVRDAVRQRLEKVRIKVKKRLAKVRPGDLDRLGEELNRMGEELEEEMEKFGDDMEKWGEHFGKQLEQQLKQKHMLKQQWGQNWGQHDHEDDDMPRVLVFGDDDDDDLDDAIDDLGSLKLQPHQREALRRLRSDSDANVARAKVQLERASGALERLLQDANASEQQVAQSIDQVTRLEAEIRKARILAWVKARKLLDDSQRKRVEGAARGRSR